MYCMECRLQLFQRFEKFRIIVFGGDGSVGWVLSAVDRFNLHSKVTHTHTEREREENIAHIHRVESYTFSVSTMSVDLRVKRFVCVLEEFSCLTGYIYYTSLARKGTDHCAAFPPPPCRQCWEWFHWEPVTTWQGSWAGELSSTTKRNSR